MKICDRILVTGRIAEEVACRLASSRPDVEFRPRVDIEAADPDLSWASGYVGFSFPHNAGKCHLKWIHSLAAGVDDILPNLPEDLDQCIVTRTIGDMPRKMAEYCLTHILGDLQHITVFYEQQKNHVWLQCPPISCFNRAITVLGTGCIGSGIAYLLKEVGFKVCGYSRSGEQKHPFDRVLALRRREAITSETTELICTLPLSNETEMIVDHELLGGLRDVHLLNVGRARVLASGDLAAALDDGTLRKVTLDVFPEEPPSSEAWFWNHPRVIMTPHISALTSIESAVDETLSVLSDLEAGRIPRQIVNRKRGY